MKIHRRLLLGAISLLMGLQLSGVTIAFDKTKSETAGNADWTIGTSPNWTGAYSDYGQALRSMGFQTISLTGSTITASSLTNVDVLIIPEPQDPFTAAEVTAILNFVNTGGGLFMIADHDGSDRNNNGWDSRRVYNESMLTATNFGISFDANSLYADPTSIIENPVTDITNGIAQVGMYAGCSITPSNGAVCHIWLRNSSEEGLVTRIYGQGRVAAYGDSSPFDDGSGNSGNELHEGWQEYNNSTLGTNVVSWLLGSSSNPVTFANVNVIPAQPHVNEQIEIRATINATQPLSLQYLYWKTNGSFNPVQMTVFAANIYHAFIPAQSVPVNIQYYLQARTTNNLVGYYPEGAPTNLASIMVSPTANEDNVITPNALSVYPNPFSASKQELKITSYRGSRIEIFNSRGKLINSFVSDAETTLWNGRDDNGKSFPSGIYLITSKTAKGISTSKILLIN